MRQLVLPFSSFLLPAAFALPMLTAGLPGATAQLQALPPTTADSPAASGWGKSDLRRQDTPAARLTGARAIHPGLHREPLSGSRRYGIRPPGSSASFQAAPATSYPRPRRANISDPNAPDHRGALAPAPHGAPTAYGGPVDAPGTRSPLHTAQVPAPPGMFPPGSGGVGNPVLPVGDPAEMGVVDQTLDGDVALEPTAPASPGGRAYDPPPVSVPAMYRAPRPDADRCRRWHVLPKGVIYKSYLAGMKEPRLGATWFFEQDGEWFWDSTLGARVGLLRYGTGDATWPEGWQLDAEGAAFPRLTLDDFRDLVSADFRFGFPLTYRRGPWETKFAYYHLSSHLGDEFLERHPGASRINYVRESLVLGLAWRPHPDWRLYSEVGYSVYSGGGAEPWEVQFGAEYSPAEPAGCPGAPFLAVNGHLREENDFGGNIAAQAGWQWARRSGDLLRLGFHYLNGTSSQYQFFRTHEQQVGTGVWYDF